LPKQIGLSGFASLLSPASLLQLPSTEILPHGLQPFGFVKPRPVERPHGRNDPGRAIPGVSEGRPRPVVGLLSPTVEDPPKLPFGDFAGLGSPPAPFGSSA